MARDNKTRYVILGVLAGGPKSGYEINKWVQGTVVHFWKESFGQIYPMLAMLCRDRLIRRTSKPTGGRERFVYHITAAGERELDQWVARPPEPLPVRNELLLKLFFGRKVGPEALIPLVEASRESAMRLTEFFAEAERALPAEHGKDPDVQYWMLTLRSGILVTQARLAWAEETLQTLRKLADSKPRAPRKRPRS